MADLAELLVRIDATTETLRRELKRGDQAVTDSARVIDLETARMRKSFESTNAAVRLNSQGLMSLQASGVNAFQALASGMSPFRVAMTEGAQVLGALVQGGILTFSNALSLLKGPLGLIAAGVTALGAAYLLLGGDTKSAAEAQEELSKALADASDLSDAAIDKSKRLAEAKRQEAKDTLTNALSIQQENLANLERDRAAASLAQRGLEGRADKTIGAKESLEEGRSILRDIDRRLGAIRASIAETDRALRNLDKPATDSELGKGLGFDKIEKDRQKAAEKSAKEQEKEETEAFHRFADGLVERGRQQDEAAKEAAKRFADQQDAVRKAQAETRKEMERADAAAQDLGFSFQSAFEDAIVSGNDLRSVIKGLEQDIAKIILRRFVTKPLGDAASGALSNIFGSLFSGGGSTGSVSSGTASATAVDALAGFRAGGGSVMASAPYIVGERGPELFIPHTSGTVVSNDNMGRGSGPVFNIDARGASVDAVVRLEKMVRTLNGSIEGRAVAAVADYSRRGR